MRNDTNLGPSAVASFVRGELARSLRSKNPYNVNLLLGGVDPITKQPHLYWLDYLASLAAVPYAAHGYAQYVLGMLRGVEVVNADGMLDIIVFRSWTNIIIRISISRRVCSWCRCVPMN